MEGDTSEVDGRWKDGTSTEDFDEQYWRRDFQPPGEAEQLLNYMPWKSREMKVNIDPRTFIANGMQTHLEKMRAQIYSAVDVWTLWNDGRPLERQGTP